ncbi:hypothetical protein AMA2_1 [Achromobacter phage AMA2]|nr:hypothetical protein AMA2_1 [Achromobacter phage AMA2]
MAVPYPSDVIPLPVRDGYEEALQNPFTRFKRDDGKFRSIRRYTTQPKTVSLTWKLTWDQLKFFEGFIEYDLKGGNEEFELQFGPNEPVRIVQFVGGPPPGASFEARSNHWKVTAKVQFMLPAPTRRPLSYYPTFPVSLPEPEKDSYEYGAPDRMLIDRDELGGGKQDGRKRFSSVRTEYRVKWLFDNEQKATFDAFLSADIADGLAYFKAPFANGMGATQLRARFTKPPVAQPEGALAWVVTASLETSEAPVISMYEYAYRNGMASQEGLFFKENVEFWVFRGQLFEEPIRFIEKVSFSLQNSYQEAIVFKEEVTLSATYSKMLETSLTFKESGLISTADYVEDSYFAESYVGYSVSF